MYGGGVVGVRAGRGKGRLLTDTKHGGGATPAQPEEGPTADLPLRNVEPEVLFLGHLR